MLRQQLDESRVVSQNIDRPRLNLKEDALVKVFDGESHVRMLANVRTFAQQVDDAERGATRRWLALS